MVLGASLIGIIPVIGIMYDNVITNTSRVSVTPNMLVI
jgi:hypothetical protein